MSVIISITGTGKHEIDTQAFNAKENFNRKDITISGNKVEKIQLELNVSDPGKPYVAVISADKNPDSRKEIVRSYRTASILIK